MPIYKQTVKFVREVSISANNAKDANEQLEELINDAEFGGNVQCDDFYKFEDEPVECPQCKGNCTIEAEDGSGEVDCSKCKGEGVIEFQG